MPAVGVRRATTADVPAVVSYGELAQTTLADVRGGDILLAREAPAPSAATVTAWLTDDDALVLLGTLDDVIVGAISARVEVLEQGQRLAVVPLLMVEPEGRELGVGEDLLNEVIAWARTKKCASVDAYALPGERETKNFFEANGFKARLLTVHHKL